MLTFNAAQRPKEVLFLCRDNGARSLMSEAILNSYSGGGMRAFSAGFEPRQDIPMPVTQVIESRGVSIKGLRPKRWAEFGKEKPKDWTDLAHRRAARAE